MKVLEMKKKLQNVVKEAFAVCLAAFCVSLFFYIAFLILKKNITTEQY